MAPLSRTTANRNEIDEAAVQWVQDLSIRAIGRRGTDDIISMETLADQAVGEEANGTILLTRPSAMMELDAIHLTENRQLSPRTDGLRPRLSGRSRAVRGRITQRRHRRSRRMHSARRGTGRPSGSPR